MTASADIIDFLERRKTHVRAHTRDRAYHQAFMATTRRLAMEVNVVTHMNEWAASFPDECLSTLNDPTLGLAS